jgi:hypothetical protein
MPSPKPQGPNSWWLGTLGLRDVTTQVFHYLNEIPIANATGRRQGLVLLASASR